MIEFIVTDSDDNENYLERGDLIGALLDIRRFDLEESIDDEIDDYKPILEQMSDQQLAEEFECCMGEEIQMRDVGEEE